MLSLKETAMAMEQCSKNYNVEQLN